MTSTLIEVRDNRDITALPGQPGGSRGPILIIGVPRSGTSWLGKIFDSHPWVLYRHEPDDVSARADFPGICAVEDIPRYADAARRYVARLTTVRLVKSVGTRPIFPKPFQRLPAHYLRYSLTLGLRAAEAVPFAAAWAKRVPIPDLISGDRTAIAYVIKSVSLLGATTLLAKAIPESRIIAIVRHPCGQVASIKRSLAGGYTQGGLFGPRVLATARARELGMTRERYEAMPGLDRCVWAWALVHAKLFEEAVNLPNVRLLSYERLCEAPVAQARELMAFANLSWTEETERFIAASTRGNGREGYYSLFRDPIKAASKWKDELSGAEIAYVMNIIAQVLPGMSFD